MNANGGATIESVLGGDDEMKGDDMSDMSPGDCGQSSMISCCWDEKLETQKNNLPRKIGQTEAVEKYLKC